MLINMNYYHIYIYIKNNNKVVKEVYFDIVMNVFRREKKVLKERLVMIEEYYYVE